ncbi:interferon-induced 35 kDa protein isoform X2 [Pseudophryne corroboree]|uniref:interferon-induced 35 kDa protein isoform X2 n=1 Tax=Pseudophryne corroboree TaxID=495146 RepID=UPI0030817337
MADQTVEEGEFVHVGDQKVTEEDLRREIQKYKEQHSALIDDIAKLEQKKWETESLTQKVQDRGNSAESTLLENEKQLHEKELKFQESVRNISLENQKLKEQAEDIKERIVYFEQETKKLEDICASGMERKVVFKGKISDNRNGLSVKHRIRYPVNSGTALITFDEPSVAAEVIAQKHHKIKIEGCWIHAKAEPVVLLVLDSLSMDMNVSTRKILVSNLPTSMQEENLLDKLELFFSKAKNGGGEVDGRGFIPEFKSAILSFLNEGVAPRLVEKKHFAVPFGNFTHNVQVSPSLNGNLTNHQMKHLVCNRTVLLTSIPDIMDSDDLQDLLALHFQKSGEVQALLYCAEGQNHVALFEDDEIPSTE